MKVPKIFISYSHDSIEHKKWILDLAIRMRNNGIDAIIDQWELKPGDDLPHFMETNIANADKIIMICSEKYVEKANSGIGGVGYEKMIITSNLIENIDEKKIIPIVRQASTKFLPTFLKTKLYIDFSKNSDYEFSFDELIRTIHNSPIYKKPEIGNNPFKQIDDSVEKKNYDGIFEIMKIIVDVFNTTTYYHASYTYVNNTFSGSRILLDILLQNTEDLGYIYRDNDNDIVLTQEGKMYAINNNLA
jgi:hypothetical protein